MRPESEAELAGMVRAAAGPLRIVGGGTRGFGRALPGEVLETGGLAGIVLYEPGALTLVAAAGTATAELEAALAAEAQRMPFEVPDLRGLLGRAGQSTIGGVVAANASGPRRVQAGACRDSLIGVRFVDGRGDVIRNGGRVMKNVTGYDLVRLMAGSQGTLGVVTEVAFKVLPKPETSATLVLHGLGVADAVAAMAVALGTPWEVTGAAHVPGQGPGAGTWLRLEGFAGSVEYRAARLSAVLARFGGVERAGTDPWPAVRDVSGFAGRAGDVWRLSVRPTDAPAIVGRIGAEDYMLDWGGGLIWALVEPGVDLRARLGAFAGHASRVRGAEAGIAAFQPEPAANAALARGLRAEFDPRGIFNAGLMEA